jgi:hypothetical protein
MPAPFWVAIRTTARAIGKVVVAPFVLLALLLGSVFRLLRLSAPYLIVAILAVGIIYASIGEDHAVRDGTSAHCVSYDVGAHGQAVCEEWDEDTTDIGEGIDRDYPVRVVPHTPTPRSAVAKQVVAGDGAVVEPTPTEEPRFTDAELATIEAKRANRDRERAQDEQEQTHQDQSGASGSAVDRARDAVASGESESRAPTGVDGASDYGDDGIPNTCDDFDNWDDAQAAYEWHGYDWLDGDGDGIACEELYYGS